MSFKKNEIFTLKKVKKDGSIDSGTLKNIVTAIIENGFIVIPVDGLYGLVSRAGPDFEKKIIKKISGKDEDLVYLISSFKMLNDLCDVSKGEYDFLHRVWPGEVIVKMKKKEAKKGDDEIIIWFPKNKFMQDLINTINGPLLFVSTVISHSKLVYEKEDIVHKYKTKAQNIFIIEEYCKEIPLPTVLDISCGSLDFIHDGRVSVDEIKSLYFLDKE
ncbi:Sua5/YciO/YrdC/YwlC family protein [Spirochaetota bacterium]